MNLTEAERAQYEWQMWVTGLGEAGQGKLKSASVLISRCGGVGGTVALELAAAGVGRLVLAHAGNLKPSDLNRQLLMSHRLIGQPRVTQAAERLRALNPHIVVEAIPENISDTNADRLVSGVDIVVDAAPLFAERFAMNAAAVKFRKPMIECAMYELEAYCTTFIPGRTGCLACLYPEYPSHWKRQFPVIGAVPGLVACLGALEVIKVLTGLGEPLANRLLTMDLRIVDFRTLNLQQNPQCPVCGNK